jgi:hypothetical protein
MGVGYANLYLDDLKQSDQQIAGSTGTSDRSDHLLDR